MDERVGGRPAGSTPSAPQRRHLGESAAVARRQAKSRKGCMVHMTGASLVVEELVTGFCMRDILSYCLVRGGGGRGPRGTSVSKRGQTRPAGAGTPAARLAARLPRDLALSAHIPPPPKHRSGVFGHLQLIVTASRVRGCRQ
jgi:hypothetical protein